MQHEEGLHLGPIIEHGTVHHLLAPVGIVLEVLVVCGDDTVCSAFDELMEHGFGQGTADLRFRTAAELVDKEQRVRRTVLHHHLHVQQVRGVGRKVVLNALFVTDIYHHIAEDSRRGILAYGDGHTALEHILKQADGLQTDGLSSGVRS